MALSKLRLEPTALQSATLVDAMIVLAELEEQAGKQTHDTELGAHEGQRLGRFMEACEIAGDALFNVLNTGHNVLDSRRFGQAIEHHRSRRRQAREA